MLDLKTLPINKIRYLCTEYIEKMGYKIESSRFADYDAELNAISIKDKTRLLVKIDASGKPVGEKALQFTIKRCEREGLDCIYIATAFEETAIKTTQNIDLIDYETLAKKFIELNIRTSVRATGEKINASLPSVAKLEELMRTGNSFYKKKDYRTALHFYEEAIRMKRNYDFAWYMKARALAGLGEYENAINAYKKALFANRKNVNAWYNMALLLGRLKRFEEELACYEQVLKIQPDFEKALLNKGVVLHNLNRFEDAIKCYEDYLAIYNTPDGWNNKAAALMRLNDFDGAMDCIEKALAIDGNHLDALFNKAMLLEQLKKYPAALAVYEKILAFKPKNLTALYRKGCCFLKLNQREAASKIFKELEKLSPDFYNKQKMLKTERPST